MGPFFKNFLKIKKKKKKNTCFWSKIPKHGSIFGTKSLKHGYIFYSKHGLGSRGPGGTPPSKPKSSTPRALFLPAMSYNVPPSPPLLHKMLPLPLLIPSSPSQPWWIILKFILSQDAKNISFKCINLLLFTFYKFYKWLRKLKPIFQSQHGCPSSALINMQSKCSNTWKTTITINYHYYHQAIFHQKALAVFLAPLTISWSSQFGQFQRTISSMHLASRT